MKNPTITAFAHTKGGVSKSTLCWHTARMLRSRGKSVSVIDLDFQQTLYFLNEIRKTWTYQDMPVIKPVSVAHLLELISSGEEDHILIDIGGFDNDMNREAIKAADRVVVPISNSVTEVLGFKTFASILEKIGKEKASVVLSNIHPLARNFEEISTAVDGEPFELLVSTVRSRKVYRESMGEGKSVFDLKSKAAKAAQKEIEELWDELNCDR